MKKQTIYNVFMWIFAAVFIISLFFLLKVKGTMSIILLVLVFASAVIGCVFSALAQREKRKNMSEFLSSSTDATKEYLANTAFNQLLKCGEDYTVAGEVSGHILVKKIIDWYYCDIGANGELHALFTITTDKGKFAFQAENKQLLRVPLDLVTSIYGEPKQEQKNDVENGVSFDDWLNAELDNLKKEKVKAFDINIYENVNGEVGAELIASKTFEEDNDDWAWNEFYSSRANGHAFYFKAKTIKEAGDFIKENLTAYLQNGAKAQILKKAEAVALGFVDGGLEIIYRKETDK